jgi:hypothetical protein
LLINRKRTDVIDFIGAGSASSLDAVTAFSGCAVIWEGKQAFMSVEIQRY